jgi:hypothetical protein
MAIIILINCPASFSFSLKCSNVRTVKDKYLLYVFLRFYNICDAMIQVVWQRTTYITLEAIAGFGKILPPWQVIIYSLNYFADNGLCQLSVARVMYCSINFRHDPRFLKSAI